MDYNIFSVFASASLVAQLIMVILIALSILQLDRHHRQDRSLCIPPPNAKATAGIDPLRRTPPTCARLCRASAVIPPLPSTAWPSTAYCEFNDGPRKPAPMRSVVVDNRAPCPATRALVLKLDRLHKHLSILATAANTAPFIGLFGTVWGIMTSFHAIGQMKSASLATVAPGISEALIATAIGLGGGRYPPPSPTICSSASWTALKPCLINFAGIFLNRVQREVNVQRGMSRGGDTSG